MRMFTSSTDSSGADEIVKGCHCLRIRFLPSMCGHCRGEEGQSRREEAREMGADSVGRARADGDLARPRATSRDLARPRAISHLQVEVVPLHVVHHLEALVGDAVLKLQRDDVGLAGRAPEEDARERKGLVAAVEHAVEHAVEDVRHKGGHPPPVR